MVDPTQFDYEHPIADIEAIRRANPQRYELEQLTGIVYIDAENHLIVGFKDVRLDEFWVRGHMPGFPLMPGVLMCEAAAQLASYYIKTQGILGGDFLAFGGMDNVKFRGVVRPGDRLVIAGQIRDIRPGRRALCEAQGMVGNTMVFQCTILGVPFNVNAAAASSGDD
jgi:3-hydroxyacyl-[acyl-carrier-protein] dehydratase